MIQIWKNLMNKIQTILMIRIQKNLMIRIRTNLIILIRTNRMIRIPKNLMIRIRTNPMIQIRTNLMIQIGTNIMIRIRICWCGYRRGIVELIRECSLYIDFLYIYSISLAIVRHSTDMVYRISEYLYAAFWNTAIPHFGIPVYHT